MPPGQTGNPHLALRDGTILVLQWSASSRDGSVPNARLLWGLNLGACLDAAGIGKGFLFIRGDFRGMAVVNVKSEIAGNVWKILLKPGDRVAVEGEIMILESMKMEIPVLSPKAGTIKEIRVAEGEAIGEGQLVAMIDA